MVLSQCTSFRRMFSPKQYKGIVQANKLNVNFFLYSKYGIQTFNCKLQFSIQIIDYRFDIFYLCFLFCFIQYFIMPYCSDINLRCYFKLNYVSFSRKKKKKKKKQKLKSKSSSKIGVTDNSSYDKYRVRHLTFFINQYLFLI